MKGEGAGDSHAWRKEVNVRARRCGRGMETACRSEDGCGDVHVPIRSLGSTASRGRGGGPISRAIAGVRHLHRPTWPSKRRNSSWGISTPLFGTVETDRWT